MTTKINTNELEFILEHTPAHQNIMLVGKHGIRKSEILSHYFEKQQLKVISLFLGQMSDPGDIIGLPTKNEQTGKTDFMPPYWFPTDNKPIVLFLDELNRAKPEILQTIMDLVLNRTLAGRKLPNQSRIISAVNEGEEYQITDLDPALVSRFNVYNFRPTEQEWLLWSVKNNIDERIISFIQENPRELDADDQKSVDQGLNKSPDRRAWVKASQIIKDTFEFTPSHKKLLAGVIGLKTTSLFFESISKDKIVSASDLLRNFNRYKREIQQYELHKLSIINESLFRYIESNYIDINTNETNVVQNLNAYITHLFDEDKMEVFAHFVSIYETGNYTNTVLFIIEKIPELYGKIISFIKGIGWTSNSSEKLN